MKSWYSGNKIKTKDSEQNHQKDRKPSAIAASDENNIKNESTNDLNISSVCKLK